LDSNIKRIYIQDQKSNDLYITKKELQCFHLNILGKTSKEIGKILSCSNRTVEAHLAKIKQKLGANSKLQLIDAIIRNNMSSIQDF
jgi:LuxR family transcriptional regulator, quorum-sensing system regulator LasR